MYENHSVEQADKPDAANGLFCRMEDAAASLGFDWLAFGVLSNTCGINNEEAPLPTVALNYPDDWRSHYFTNDYQGVDPVVRYSQQIALPYAWRDLSQLVGLGQEERKVLDEARDAGLRRGASVPLHGPCGWAAVVSFASSDISVDTVGSLPRLQSLASVFLTEYFRSQGLDRSGRRLIRLSARERECLEWIAQGKSSWDTGQILGISENTVNYHVKKILAKLDVSTRTMAVVKALRLGLIMGDIPCSVEMGGQASWGCEALRPV